jgi:hypothetical protein
VSAALWLTAAAWSAAPDWERDAWALDRRANVEHSDLPALLEEARALAVQAEHWPLVHSDAVRSRDMVRAASGEGLVADLDGLLGFFARDAVSLVPVEQPWWGAVWPIRETAEEAVYQQAGMLRHHRGSGFEAISAAVRDWQVLRTPMGAVVAYEAEHCLERHLLLYKEDVLVGTFKQSTCRSTAPAFIDAQWPSRARDPDWATHLDSPDVRAREALHLLSYGQDGALESIHVYRWLTMPSPEHLVYVPVSHGEGN